MIRYLLWLVLVMTGTLSIAGPGAHGPNGEHLDVPGGQPSAAPSVPRLEAASERFELLGRLHEEEFSILVDRFDTNEPVENARIEAEAGGIKDVAQFHADHGDYSFTDPALLKALRQPGQHPIVFTIVAGAEKELLEGTLQVGAARESNAAQAHSDHDHEHGDDHDHHWERPAIVIAAFLLLALVSWFFRRHAISKK